MKLCKSILLFILPILIFSNFSAAKVKKLLLSDEQNEKCEKVLSVIRQNKMPKNCQNINTLLNSVMQSDCSQVVQLLLKRHLADRFSMSRIPVKKDCKSSKETLQRKRRSLQQKQRFVLTSSLV